MTYYKVAWVNNDGKICEDWFVNQDDPRWKTYNVSYVEKWKNPAVGVRRFLSHIPLNSVIIEKYE